MSLKETFDKLEKRYVMKSEAHSKRFSSGIQNEGAYQDSSRELMQIYEELQRISVELNTPIPVWMKS
jgi:hypothetical protein